MRIFNRPVLPEEVQVELIQMLFSSLPQAAILAVTVAASGSAFAAASGAPVDALLATVAACVAASRVGLILLFKRYRRGSTPMGLPVALAWSRAFGGLALAVGACLALLTLRAAALDRLDFVFFFFGIILSFCTGAATRSAVVPWIPISTGHVMVAACIFTLTRRPEIGCQIGGWFLFLMLAAYAEACLHLEGTVIDKITARRAVAWAAAHDGLTGLPNRASFTARLEAACLRAVEGGAGCAVLYLDLDRFKAVNDTLGHAAGDELLKQVAERLRAVAGTEAIAHRLGGDEFAVLLETEATTLAARALASRIVSEVGRPYALAQGPADVGISVGIAHAPEDATDPGVVLNLADRALYAAKGGGRGRWVATTRAEPRAA